MKTPSCKLSRAARRRGVVSVEYAMVGVAVVGAAIAFANIDWTFAISAINDVMSS